MRAVLLERNKMVSRRLVRYFASAGIEAIPIEDPALIPQHVPTADLICADTFDGDLVAAQVKAKPTLRGILWTAEPLKRSMRYLVENQQISNVLGRKDFESTPKPWELMMVLRRIIQPAESAPSISAYLDWGYTGFQDKVASTAGRDAAVAHVQNFINALQVPKRIGEMFGELTHEMLMNALYDAPAGADGKAKYAQDRKADLVLPDAEQPTLRLATDGTKIVLQVKDPFGRLQRKHVFDGLARGLAQGEMDQSHGGAGLGMMVCHNSTAAMFFDVVRGRHTEVTGIFELDLNLREFRTQAKSLHFFQA
ncbi:MAG TPA: ATP-binding protein [Kofleriaceae bacterium]|jgi:hypothetical protein|nr:ATP-binding protein [Kofleriaceae bacterium]